MPEHEIEKYGVEETDEDIKTAAEGKKCPNCGGELRSRDITGVLLCVKCGSKPFEVTDKGRHAEPLK